MLGLMLSAMLRLMLRLMDDDHCHRRSRCEERGYQYPQRFHIRTVSPAVAP
jgi:hypothetical protein